jgi:REP element-mobilizing transposase RayT
VATAARAPSSVNDDYALYRDLLAEHCRAADVAVWAWCLMPNHVHLTLVPSDIDGLRRAHAAVHRRYAGVIRARRKRTGHFWQGRFGAVAMDEEHLAAALRYVSLNPVRARLVACAQDWRLVKHARPSHRQGRWHHGAPAHSRTHPALCGPPRDRI